jgi:transcriptional regulator with XRE-family HTH domain
VDHDRLAEFLRTRREALRPADVGMPTGGARRKPSLRREEVAALAGMSPDRYERLERGRAAQPTTDMMADLGRALRLDRAELAEACRLAGLPPPASGGRYVEPGMMLLLDALAGTPACVLDEALTVVAQNSLAEAVLGRCAGLPGWRSNLVWHWFTDERLRARCAPERHTAFGRALAAELRALVAWHGADRPVGRLAADLRTASEQFARQWTAAPIAPFEPVRLSIGHADAGLLELSGELAVSASTGHRLLVLRPLPGTLTVVRLRQLPLSGAAS